MKEEKKAQQKEQHKELMKVYYQKNKDKLKANMKIYYEKNKKLKR